MTVAELIAELQKYPQHLPVNIEGYEKGSERRNCRLAPTWVHGVHSETDGDSIVIWANFPEHSS